MSRQRLDISAIKKWPEITRGRLDRTYAPIERAAAEKISYNLEDPKKRTGVITSILGSLFEGYLLAAFTKIPYAEIVNMEGRVELKAAHEGLEILFANDAPGLQKLRSQIQKVAQSVVDEEINQPIVDRIGEILANPKGKSHAQIIGEFAGSGFGGSTAKGDLFFQDLVLELKYVSPTKNLYVKWLTTSAEKILQGQTPFVDFLEMAGPPVWYGRARGPEANRKWAGAVSNQVFNKYWGAMAPTGESNLRAFIGFILAKGNPPAQLNKRLVIGSKVATSKHMTSLSITLDLDVIMWAILGTGSVDLENNRYLFNREEILKVSTTYDFFKSVRDNANAGKSFPAKTGIQFEFGAYALQRLQNAINKQ